MSIYALIIYFSLILKKKIKLLHNKYIFLYKNLIQKIQYI